ncbi:MAG: hypothetical protein AB7I30_02565 [Isosphaeraceae bacterium]
MGWIIWGGPLAACLLAGWLILRRPVQRFTEELHVDHARVTFRQQRERLEARFVAALAYLDPIEHYRWDRAHWHDEVLWARDRKSRVFLAMIGVHFDEPVYDAIGEPQPRHATALFEYRKGRWCADGKRLDEIRPDEAVFQNRRFEPVLIPYLPPRTF